jgi:hypothetical protein
LVVTRPEGRLDSFAMSLELKGHGSQHSRA